MSDIAHTLLDTDPCRCIKRTPLKPQRLRRYSGCGNLEIDPTVVKTWFTFAASGMSPDQQLLLGRTSLRIEILRKGKEDVIASYNAFSIDNDSNVCFYWDDVFLTQPPGFYLGDLFLGGKYCFTVLFRIRPCTAIVTKCRNEYEEPCNSMESGVIGGAECEVVPCIPTDIVESYRQNQAAHTGTDECLTGAAGHILSGVDDE